ncbi:MAG: hypothetical protein AAF542_24445 [Pseudomonadota bacterium]
MSKPAPTLTRDPDAEVGTDFSQSNAGGQEPQNWKADDPRGIQWDREYKWLCYA